MRAPGTTVTETTPLVTVSGTGSVATSVLSAKYGAVLAKVAAGRPLGRLAGAQEIAAVIVFLCSPRASYVTGAAWSADGGTVPIIV